MPTLDIHVIAASAGSGKTRRLAEALNKALEKRQVRPEGIVGVTFTNKAAAELQQRVRTGLLEARRFEDAHRLAAGRFGTVNAVCGRFVAEHCFELGLPPEQVILDERGAATAIRRALSLAVRTEQTELLEDLRDRLYALDWEELVHRVLSLARANRMTAADLRTSCDRSLETLEELLGSRDTSSAADPASLEQAFHDTLARFQRERAADDQTNKTAEFAERVEEARFRLDRGLPLQWDAWARLARQQSAKKSEPLAAVVREAASAYVRHLGFREDIVALVRLVFDIASRTLEVYTEEKRSRGAVDFIDQETLALHLLARPRVREQLRSEIDLVLVDEFQDTSPVQLEIFLRLAELADRSIWVGDQKQAIYGFRGSDPALMDAVIETLLVGGVPETLRESWRSRAPLVDLTSDLFVRAFSRFGMPESRVRLKAAEPADVRELGPVAEHWRLTAKNKDQDAACLAAGAQALRQDPALRVRDPEGGSTRRPRWSDIALLCRTNADCAAAARELGRLGVPCRVPSAGLLATPEGQLALAGLKLWADPYDRLALAVLRRLAARSPEECLEATLAPPESAPISEWAEAVTGTRARHAGSGPLESLEHVLETLEARLVCLEWGEHRQRLANLDALRAHAVNYLEACASEGRPVTVVGLVRWLEELRERGADTRAVDMQADAVTVITWHAAKGLEWPVVVLYEYELERPPVPLGAHVIQDGEISLSDPLAGRWIRFWPNPFHPGRRHTILHDRLADHPASAELERRDEKERLRLLYVGWTRARDRLILTSRLGKGELGQTHRVLADADGPLLRNAEESGTTWGGKPVDVALRILEPAEPIALVPEAGEGYAASGPIPRAVALLRASEMLATGARIAETHRLGDRLQLKGDVDMDRLGQAVHGFLASDTGDLSNELRLVMAEGLLSRWGVAGSLGPAELLEASDRLHRWVRGSSTVGVYREVPVSLRQGAGTVARGIADLALDHGETCSVLDHKTFPGGHDGLEERLSHYAGQLSLYGRGLSTAWGRPCSAMYLHLPVLGLVARIAVEGSR